MIRPTFTRHSIDTIPVEIFNEICFHATPSCLLALSCCSKRLASLTIETSQIWRTAWINMEYPQLPISVVPFVSYKLLVLLVTRVGCQFCDSAPQTKTIEWFELRRVCPRCSYSGLRRMKLPDIVDPSLPGFTKWVTKVIKPIKPRSAYVLFGNANRERIRKENPGIGFSQWGKVLSALWARLPEEEVQVGLSYKNMCKYSSTRILEILTVTRN
ncbi:hypothetical protein BDR26DRAFT_947189 [Obelidium mucronatum]|nr:hypothetical protein BDR26DRAFT_947189 [Obelidium mucronatum]